MFNMSDQDLFAALERHCYGKGITAKEMCKELNVTQNTWTNWKKGKSINSKNRFGIISIIGIEIPDLRPPSHVNVVTQSFSAIEDKQLADTFQPYMSIVLWAHDHSMTHISFPAGKDGDIVIVVTDGFLSPPFPINSYLLSRPGACIATGDTVIVLMDNGNILARTFIERDDDFMLVSLVNDESQNLIIPKRGPQGIKLMLRVIQSIRNETQQHNGKERDDDLFWKKYLDSNNKENKS